MKVHFMKDEALAYFKGNISANIDHYIRDKDNKWVDDTYKNYKDGGESAFAEFKLEIPDFQMDIYEEKPEYTDFNNVKILYTALKDVSDTQATDERLWVGLAHNDLWEYMRFRCGFIQNDINVNKIKSNFFFNYGNKRSLLHHPIARLWWVGRLIYDNEKENPFEALEYLRTDFATKVLSLFSSNFTNNPNIVRAILIAIYEIEQSGNKVSRNRYLELIRYVNLLGGFMILDYLTEEELTQKIIQHYCELDMR